MGAQTTCLEESMIWSFLHDEVATDEAAVMRGHVADCEECRELVAVLARSVTPAALDDTAVSGPSFPARLTIDPDAKADEVLVDGKYRVVKSLGTGAMGYVVEATHVRLGTRVALKFLHRNIAENHEMQVRFRREARASARIQSPHVVRVFDVATREDGAPFLVMELLKGHDLATELRTRGALPAHEAVQFILQAIHALAEAHRLGIIHRDLKPANMFVIEGPRRHLKLLDFGVSKEIRGSNDEAFETAASSWIGTPRYMAPEQLKLAHLVDARTDIWGLGVVLHQLIAGQLPFAAQSLDAHCRAVLTEDPISLDKVRPDVPAELARVVRRCLSKDPSHRYASVTELATALMPFSEVTAAPMSRLAGLTRTKLGKVAIASAVGLGLLCTGIAIHFTKPTAPTMVGRPSLDAPIMASNVSAVDRSELRRVEVDVNADLNANEPRVLESGMKPEDRREVLETKLTSTAPSARVETRATGTRASASRPPRALPQPQRNSEFGNRR